MGTEKRTFRQVRLSGIGARCIVHGTMYEVEYLRPSHFQLKSVTQGQGNRITLWSPDADVFIASIDWITFDMPATTTSCLKQYYTDSLSAEIISKDNEMLCVVLSKKQNGAFDHEVWVSEPKKVGGQHNDKSNP